MTGWCVLAAGALYLGESGACFWVGKNYEGTMMLCYAAANGCLYAILHRPI